MFGLQIFDYFSDIRSYTDFQTEVNVYFKILFRRVNFKETTKLIKPL